jgi:hypothetical protein
MSNKTLDADAIVNRARPLVHQQAHEIQPYGHLNQTADRAIRDGVSGVGR